MEGFHIFYDECFLFRPGPFFDLGFTAARGGKIDMNFDPGNRFRRVKFCGAAGASVFMPVKALVEISGASNVETTGLETEDVNEGNAPRQARGHSSRIADERHWTNETTTGDHEQAKRVEWLRRLGSNQRPIG